MMIRATRKENLHKNSRFLAAARTACSKASSLVLLSPFFKSISMLDARIFLVLAPMGYKSPILHHGFGSTTATVLWNNVNNKEKET